jgi:hypothetical protein
MEGNSSPRHYIEAVIGSLICSKIGTSSLSSILLRRGGKYRSGPFKDSIYLILFLYYLALRSDVIANPSKGRILELRELLNLRNVYYL